jgi:hypothetical protein
MIKTMQDAFDALDDLKQALNLAYSSGYRRGQEAEREACAKFFEDHWRETWTDEQVAEAIRARGKDA